MKKPRAAKLLRRADDAAGAGDEGLARDLVVQAEAEGETFDEYTWDPVAKRLVLKGRRAVPSGKG